MCYGFTSTALIHTGVNWVCWGTLTEDFVSVKDTTLERGGTAKLFHPKDFYISGASCEIGGYPGDFSCRLARHLCCAGSLLE